MHQTVSLKNVVFSRYDSLNKSTVVFGQFYSISWKHCSSYISFHVSVELRMPTSRSVLLFSFMITWWRPGHSGETSSTSSLIRTTIQPSGPQPSPASYTPVAINQRVVVASTSHGYSGYSLSTMTKEHLPRLLTSTTGGFPLCIGCRGYRSCWRAWCVRRVVTCWICSAHWARPTLKHSTSQLELSTSLSKWNKEENVSVY